MNQCICTLLMVSTAMQADWKRGLPCTLNSRRSKVAMELRSDHTTLIACQPLTRPHCRITSVCSRSRTIPPCECTRRMVNSLALHPVNCDVYFQPLVGGCRVALPAESKCGRGNQAVHLRTACAVFEVENQSSVPGDGRRSSHQNIVSSEPNPYEPPPAKPLVSLLWDRSILTQIGYCIQLLVLIAYTFIIVDSDRSATS